MMMMLMIMMLIMMMLIMMMMLMMVRKATVMILITTVHVIISTTPSSPACTWIATTTSTSTMEHMPLETSGWAGHQFGWSEKNKSSVRQSRWRRKFFGVMSISSQLQKRNKTKRAPPPLPPFAQILWPAAAYLPLHPNVSISSATYSQL